MTRREVNVGILAGAALAAAPGAGGAQGSTAVKLPPPRKAGGMPLFAALALRRSTREYSDRPLPPQALSDLLWAAFGVNRPDGGRTAPYARHIIMIDLYVATAEGVWLYEPVAHALLPHMKDDIREATGQQDFVGHAALELDLCRTRRAHERRFARGAACSTPASTPASSARTSISSALRRAWHGLSRRARRGQARSGHEAAERAVRDLRADGRIAA